MATNDCVGTKGRESLREALSSADPVEIGSAIEDFQTRNAILVPSLKSALGLYDLFGTPRHSYYLAAAEGLRDKFIDHLTHLGQPVREDTVEKLNDYLLRYSNLALDVPILQPVIYTVAMTVPSLSEEVLEKLTAPSFFDTCPTELRQKIYEQRPSFFKNAIFRLVASYINSIEASFRSAAACGHSSKLSPDLVNSVRKHDSITSIATLVGHNTRLYASVHSILDEIFEETENDIVCCMKSSIILSLAGASETLRQNEPFYKVCWCFDTSVRSQQIETKQLKQLQGVCESVKDIGTLAILLADPLFVDLACKKLISLAVESVATETLLRNTNYAQFLVYLLKLGHHNLLVKKNFRGFQDMVDFSAYFDFIAALSTLVLEGRNNNNQGDSEKSEKPVDSYIVKTAECDILCWLLLLHHCQLYPSAIAADVLVASLPDDGLTDSILFELTWTLGPMLQQRPSYFLDTVSALLSKISSENTASEIICTYTMRLFDLGLSLLESTLVHQLPAIIGCIKTTVASLDHLSDHDREKLTDFFENVESVYNN